MKFYGICGAVWKEADMLVVEKKTNGWIPKHNNLSLPYLTGTISEVFSPITNTSVSENKNNDKLNQNPIRIYCILILSTAALGPLVQLCFVRKLKPLLACGFPAMLMSYLMEVMG